MEIQNLLDKIINDATAAANEYYSNANARIDEIKRTLSESLEEKKQNLNKQLSVDADSIKERTTRMYELESKKRFLAQKREIIEECFDEAEKKFISLDRNTLKKYFHDILISNVYGGEKVILCKDSLDFLNVGYINEINEELQRIKKDLLVVSDEVENGFGLCLVKNGVEICLTSSAIISEKRFLLEQQVADILFEN